MAQIGHGLGAEDTLRLPDKEGLLLQPFHHRLNMADMFRS
jgi:hypothetical protein